MGEVCPVENIRDIEWTRAVDLVVQIEGLGGGRRRGRASDINQSEALEWLDEQGPTIVVATGGSLGGDAAAWAYGRGRVFEWSTAGKGKSSSFGAECGAHEDALVWLSKTAAAQDGAFLLANSVGLMSKIRTGYVRPQWIPLFRNIKGVFVGVCVPGHCGISFGGKADRLAGRAGPVGDLVLAPGGVVAGLSATLAEEGRLKQQEFWSTQRLVERGRSCGDGAGRGV